MIKSFLKKIVPKDIFSYYHKSLAIAANLYYGRPSEKMIVIGVTGTNGKSSTVDFITRILESAGHKVGYTSTAMFKVADREWLNDKKMTMLGRFALQRLLKQMVSAGCRYAVIETSSEGIKQFRNIGINYDVVVFTNLTPEHLESHGGFENYKKAKQELFARLMKGKTKIFNGQKIKKTMVANLDDEHAMDFINFDAEDKIGFAIDSQKKSDDKLEIIKGMSKAEIEALYKEA